MDVGLTQVGAEPSRPEQEVILENDLFVTRWTSRGGVLKSWVLRNYSDGSTGGMVDLVSPGGKGLAVVVDGKELSDIDFDSDGKRLSPHGRETATLTWRANWKDSIVEKKVTLAGNRYDVQIEVQVTGALHEAIVGLEWIGGIGRTELHLQEEMDQTKVKTYMAGVPETWDIAEANSARSRPSGEGGWIGVRNKYFLAALVPETQARYRMEIRGQIQEGIRKRFDVGSFTESKTGAWNGYVYCGPISYAMLKQYGAGLDQAMSWGWEWARGLMEPIGIGILKVFLMIHQVAGNYGLVIILFSILVKIALYPLTHKSYEATAKMQEVQPQITALREKYPNDQQRMNTEMMRLYKEQGVNPLGGCLPMLSQMPILFALFNVFQNAIELRQAPFMLWIKDLSQPEDLHVAGMPVHVLPILMALTMFFQQKMTMKDPKQKMMVYLMPLMMVFFFWGMSSGLVLYWTLFNLLSWVQQLVIERVKNIKDARG